MRNILNKFKKRIKREPKNAMVKSVNKWYNKPGKQVKPKTVFTPEVTEKNQPLFHGWGYRFSKSMSAIMFIGNIFLGFICFTDSSSSLITKILAATFFVNSYICVYAYRKVNKTGWKE